MYCTCTCTVHVHVHFSMSYFCRLRQCCNHPNLLSTALTSEVLADDDLSLAMGSLSIGATSEPKHDLSVSFYFYCIKILTIHFLKICTTCTVYYILFFYIHFHLYT